MNDSISEEASSSLPKPRNSRAINGPKLTGSKILSKVTSSVKFLVRATNQTHHTQGDPENKKVLLRKDSRQNMMRVTYMGPNGQLNNRALLVTKERLDFPINIDNDEDRKLIINVMLKRPHKRHDMEVIFLQRAFRDIGFFQKMESELDASSFKKLFAALQLEVCDPGTKLFNYGDIGTKFYIIIQGSVYILVNKDGIAAETKFSKNESEDPEIIKKKNELSKFLRDTQNEGVKIARVEECYPGTFVIKHLDQGDAFGEIALQSNIDRRRTATVVCREKTLFGVLTYENFKTILGAFYERKYQEKVNFFLQMDLFQHWRGSQLACLILHMEEVKLSRNHVVFKEGDRSNRLYFIRKGEIELRKKVELSKSQDPEEEILLAERSLGRRIRPQKKAESMRLAILTEGDYFGESELIEMKPREYTAVVLSTEVTLISISRTNFMTFVCDQQTLENLKEHIKKKNNWREELTSKFVHVHTKAEEKMNQLANSSKVTQSLNNLDLYSQHQNHVQLEYGIEIHKPFYATSYNNKMNEREAQKNNGYSKTVTKIGKIHRHTLSLTKLEQEYSFGKEPNGQDVNQPKVLPFISMRKGLQKVETAYQKHKKRLAKRLNQDKDRHVDNEDKENERVTEGEDRGKSNTHRAEPGRVLNENNKIEKKVTTQSKALYNLLRVSPKNKVEGSVSGTDQSLSNLDPQSNFKAYSLNTLNTLDSIEKSNPTSLINLGSTTRPVKPRHNELFKKKSPYSLTDLEIACPPGANLNDSLEKQSSTVRLNNKLKKILQIRDNPESTRVSSSRPKFIDHRIYSSLNDIGLSISSKFITPSPFNRKPLNVTPSNKKEQ